MDTKRICLWSSPRNLSTALMYSFAQRPDTIVFDEPLYAHYLKITGISHPGQQEILEAQEADGEKVVSNIILASYNKPVVFFKQMTHHLIALNENFLSETINVIFIRDPKEIITSYAAVRPQVNMQDVGIEKQWNLYHQLVSAGKTPVVLDSNEILKNPPGVLRAFCEKLNIPFFNSMLHWPAGPKLYDGIWAKYWYENVHKSTGFKKQQTIVRPLPEYLNPLYNACKKYYDLLSIHTLKA